MPVDQYDSDPQCQATCIKRLSKGRVKVWFCWLDPGHDGEHRSYRKSWAQEPGERALVKGTAEAATGGEGTKE